MDNALKKMVFGPDATISEALECCLSGGKKVCFCLDENGLLKGILTEGDILRAFQDGAQLKDPASKFINDKPIAVSDQTSLADAKKLLGNRIQLVPKVDVSGHLVGYVDMLADEYGFVKIKSKKITILGLGYVGLTMGLVMADEGFAVKGLDIDKKLISKLRCKKPPFFEAGIQDLIDNNIDTSLRLVDSIEDARADVYVITVGTPVDKKTKEPQMEAIKKAAGSIGSVLSEDSLVILRSTVMVGTTRDIVIPELEKASGLKAGEDFFVAFCPERTAEGRALRELRELPQLIGGFDERSIELAARLFNEYTPTVIRTESIEAAELCKLIDNCYRDVRFAFANQVAEIAERLGLNIHNIINAVNLNYARNSIPTPSPGVAGPCLIKDPYILSKVYNQHDMEAPLLMSARALNEAGAVNVVDKAEKHLERISKKLADSRVFVVGFAFKGEPETSDLRDSTSLLFLDRLKKFTSNIVGYDPVAFADEMEELGIEVVDNVEAGFKGADVVFVMNNHRSYLQWDIDQYLLLMNRPALFYDCWHMFADRNITAMTDVVYASIGVGS